MQHIDVGIILVAAGFAMLLGNRSATLRPQFRSLRLAPEMQARVLAALEAREAVDGAMPRLMRAAGLICLVCAALELVPQLPATVPFALYLVGYAVAAGFIFTRGPSGRATRIAALEVRSPRQALQPQVTALCVVAAVCSLVVVGVPGFGFSAVVATAAALCLVAVAWWTTAAPARLLGDDLPAERFVDDRLRRIRVGTIATMGCVAPFVLIGMADLRTLAAGMAFGLALICTVLANVMILRQPDGATSPVDA